MTARRRLAPVRILLCCAPLLGACSTLVTPDAIRASGAREELVTQVIGLYELAVAQANGFLASPQRLSLPPAHYEVTPEEPLVFVTGSRRWPIRIRNSAGGDLVLAFGFRAQERDDGSSLKVLERVFQEHAESLAPCTQ